MDITICNFLTKKSDDGDNKSVHGYFVVRSNEMDRKKIKLLEQKNDE